MARGSIEGGDAEFQSAQSCWISAVIWKRIQVQDVGCLNDWLWLTGHFEHSKIHVVENHSFWNLDVFEWTLQQIWNLNLDELGTSWSAMAFQMFPALEILPTCQCTPSGDLYCFSGSSASGATLLSQWSPRIGCALMGKNIKHLLIIYLIR